MTGTVPPGAATSIEEWTRPNPGQLARFRELPTANVADAMHRLGALDSRIKPAWPGATLVGAAYTVWTRPGDNLGIHEALRHAEPGDVLVVNGGGDESRALIGELIAGRAKGRGVAGFVIDGAIRDADGLAEYDMPVFARAATPAGPYKHGPFALATPVAVGGVVVHPGDIVVGDADGVVVVPTAMADQVIELAKAKHDEEARVRETIDADISRAQAKRSIVDIFAARPDVAIVDIAILGPVVQLGVSTPLMAAGPAAGTAARLIRPLGADVIVLDGQVGDAMAHKLLRSVFMKGVAAAVTESVTAGRAAGKEDWIRDQIARALAGDGQRTIDRFLNGSVLHARRRADEMDAAAAYLTELGVDTTMATATAEHLRRLSQPSWKDGPQGRAR